MQNVTKKQAIVQSLETMKASEMDQVIDYIKDLIKQDAEHNSYENFKKRAMDEIQQALNSDDLSLTA